MDFPLVSVIIVNYNGKDYLEECLKNLMKSTYKKFEVILVDNNSTDDSVEFVKSSYPSITIIKLDKNYGFAEPNNVGSKIAKGELLLFLNNDTKPTANFITEMITVIQKDPKIAICQSLLLKPNGDVDSSGDFIDNIGRVYSKRTKLQKVEQILSARGAAMLVRKNIFWKLGGFDKNFFASFEDVDLGWRAWMWGYKVVVVPSSVVYHYSGGTIKELESQVRFHGVKNTIIIQLTNFEASFALKSIVTMFFVVLFQKIFGISIIKDLEQSLPLPTSKTIVQGIIWILKHFKYIQTKRKEVNSRRVRTTHDLINLELVTKIR